MVILIGVITVTPSIPLALAWCQAMATKEVVVELPARTRLLLFVTTASFLLLLVGLVWKPIIGLDHTLRRFISIYVNLGINIVTAVFSTSLRRPIRIPMVVSASTVALEWLYVATVSSVV